MGCLGAQRFSFCFVVPRGPLFVLLVRLVSSIPLFVSVLFPVRYGHVSPNNLLFFIGRLVPPNECFTTLAGGLYPGCSRCPLISCEGAPTHRIVFFFFPPRHPGFFPPGVISPMCVIPPLLQCGPREFYHLWGAPERGRNFPKCRFRPPQ